MIEVARLRLAAMPDRVRLALEWTGAALGMSGALLLAMNTAISGWGWVAFLGSNFAWLAYALLTRQRGLFTQQVLFTATSLLGISQWLR